MDAHGSNTLTETSGTIDSTTGKINNCRDFEAGDTEYFTIAGTGDFALGDQDFTFSCWVNAESLANNATVLSKWLSTGNQRSFALFYTTATSRWRWMVSNNGSATASVDADNLGAPSTATWYFIVVWHDATNNVIGIQINNGTANTTSHTTGVFNSTAEFDFGRSQAGLASHDGLIDEVGFWGRILTTQEKTDLYNAGNGLAYPFATGNRRRRVLCAGAV